MAAAFEWAVGTAEAGYPTFPKDEHERKLVRVSLWLKKIYGNHLIPFYEVNERTVNILYDVMERCEAKERDVSLLIEDMKHQEAVYKAATKEMQDIFKDLRLSQSSLSREASKCLSSLAKSAAILERKDTSLTSLFCAINSITSELFETRQKNKEMWRKLDVTKKKLTSALTLEKQLLNFQIRACVFHQLPLSEAEGKLDSPSTFNKGFVVGVKEPDKTQTIPRDVEDIEQYQAIECVKRKSRSQTLKYLKDKSLELRIRIRDAETELIACGLDRSLTHGALVQFSEKLAPVQKEVMSLKKQLGIYLDLPLSIFLAEMKVEKEKRELKALEDELSEELDRVAFSMM